MIKKLLARIAWRAVKRRSPKAELVGGAPAAVVVGALLAMFLEPELAAAIAAPTGSLITTFVNLLAAEGPEESGQ